MASESLSQNEIDLLFGSGGETPAPRVPRQVDPRADVQVYDFRRPARISKDRKRSLMAMYGLLAKSVESWLTGRVRDQVELELQSVEQLTFGEFVLALPSPSASYIVDVGRTGSQGVIDIGHEFGYFVVDRFLGGTGAHAIPERPLTPMERLIVRIVADRVAYQLSDVWKDYVRLDLEVSGFESIPEMLQVARREDPVLVANIGVSMGDLTSLLLLCLPFATLEKFFTGHTTQKVTHAHGSDEERVQDRERIETSVRTARVTLGARLPAFDVSLKTLADLEPGQILSTGLPPNTELELFVAGQKRFRGVAGRVDKNLAVRILDVLPPEPEDLIHPGRTDLT